MIQGHKSKKAVIFCRVSSKDQEEGHSLEAQMNSAIEFCTKNNFIVIEKFSITESASKAKRPEFDKMIDFIEKQKEKIHIVCYAVDRLHRDLKSAGTIIDLASTHKIVVHFLRDNSTLDADSDDFVHMINVLLARREVKVLGKRVRHVFDKKREEGTILGPAPIGYLNMARTNDQKRAIIELDPNRSWIIKAIFEEYATGLHSMMDVRINATNRRFKNVKR